VARSDRNGDAKVEDLDPPGVAGFRAVLVQQLDDTIASLLWLAVS
jgi:hypothetical protein